MTDTSHDTPDPITVAARFNGPPGSANGGYVSGRVARFVDAPAVRVRLRTPPPLETPMEVRRTPGGGVHLLSGEELVAEGAPAPVPQRHTAPVPPAEAERAQEGYRGLRDHPFPTCFVCGTAREAGDGLRLFAGPVGGDPAATTVACVWRPGPDTTDTPMEWAALDCPGGWSVDITGRPMLLGQLTAAVFAPVRAGRAHVVVGRLLDVQGRKVRTASALYDGDGAELARAEAVWIRLREG
ncbi:hypothetical protein NI17_004600 [Thermobifida halotolerans]|uniref:Thioesterase domain-containing protein n=1 Tax=Thermobifida halotolerans TaxID=483545 RepID=A0AA97LYL4_9ACTN|nr:hypothetical protein [Thermobifida halotolerans]UOE20510.1 hypothetical protein NI17_004600 [Thermobifida halotolerans]